MWALPTYAAVLLTLSGVCWIYILVVHASVDDLSAELEKNSFSRNIGWVALITFSAGCLALLAHILMRVALSVLAVYYGG